jgi:hypothetical protein
MKRNHVQEFDDAPDQNKASAHFSSPKLLCKEGGRIDAQDITTGEYHADCEV